MKKQLIVSMLAVLGLSACSYDIGHFKEVKRQEFVQLELARWQDAKIINMTVENNGFRPMVFRVEAGRPYVLKMLNLDDSTHSFRAPDFFDTIHYDLLHDKGRYYKMRYITSLELEPNIPKEYYFIPTEPENSEAQRFEFDSANYAVAIPPVHLSFYGENTVHGTYGVITVEPQGTLCLHQGGEDNCVTAKKDKM